MNLFDGLQQTAFAIVANTMGYAANWSPGVGGPSQNAIVLFKDASETAKLLEIDYDPQRAMIEYYDTDFVGLLESANGKNDEIINVNGVNYGVNEVIAKRDGKTLIAMLQAI